MGGTELKVSSGVEWRGGGTEGILRGGEAGMGGGGFEGKSERRRIVVKTVFSLTQSHTYIPA